MEGSERESEKEELYEEEGENDRCADKNRRREFRDSAATKHNEHPIVVLSYVLVLLREGGV